MKEKKGINDMQTNEIKDTKETKDTKEKKETKIQKEKVKVEENTNIKDSKIEKNKKGTSNKLKSGIYFGYIERLIICVVLFVSLFGLSLLFLSNTLNVKEKEVINYNESGFLDYKVYLKPNEFYEEEYLDKNMNYIASLIENINVDINYQFVIDEPTNMDFSYQVIGKLNITSDGGQSRLYEKEYILKEGKVEPTSDAQNVQEIRDSLTIDYDYYNELANRFRSTYGVETTSSLDVLVKINKSATNDSKNINIDEDSNMSLSIPLSQKTLNIQMNETGISNANSIVNEPEFKITNIICGILSFVCFVASVAALLKTLELLFMLSPKKSKYDKFVMKMLKEYDRLIVETPTQPNFTNKEIVKINKFEELIDARDNLKRPVMYYNLTNHQKSYFYIEVGRTVYLYTVKAADLETEDDKKNKKKI